MSADWPALLRLSVTRFGIAPEAFWRLSVLEWRALSGALAPPSLTRGELNALQRRFPDS